MQSQTFRHLKHLVETPSQTVTHLVLPAGKLIGQHHVLIRSRRVPVKGRILSDEEKTAEIYPGVTIRMASMKHTSRQKMNHGHQPT